MSETSNDFETREEAWQSLAEALAIMLDKPKVDWPAGVEQQRIAAEAFLDENPPTPATLVTMRLARESLQEVVDAVVSGVLSLWEEDSTVEPEAHEVSTVPTADVFIDPPVNVFEDVGSSDDSAEDDHVCRANLDVDDRCTVCGTLVDTRVRVAASNGVSE